MLVGHYVEDAGVELHYLDEVVGEVPPAELLVSRCISLLAHNP